MPTKQYVKKINGFYVKDEEAREAIEAANTNILKRVKTYDNVAAMKADESLTTGEHVITKGYRSINDGGQAQYVIVEDNNLEDDGGTVHALTNGLKAVLNNTTIYPETFGAKGDGTTDDTQTIQAYIDYCLSANKAITLKSDSVYSVSGIEVNAKASLYGNGATIKARGETAPLSVEITTNNSKVLIRNLVIDGNDLAEIGLHIIECRNLEFCESEIKNITGYGLKYDAGYELYVHNVNIYNTSVHDNSYAIYTLAGDSVFNDIVVKQFKTAVYNGAASNIYNRIHGWNTFPQIVKGSVFFELYAGCVITECYNDTYQYGYKIIRGSRDVNLNNCNNYTNADYINNEVLDNEDVYIFYFDDTNTEQTKSELSRMVKNHGMKVSIGSYDGTIKYSNIERTEWKNDSNEIANNPDTAHILTGTGLMPVGSFYEITPGENVTVQRNTVIVSDNMVYVNYVCTYSGTVQSTNTGVVIGVMPSEAKMPVAIESYAAKNNARYTAPTEMVDVFVTPSNNNITVHFPDPSTATGSIIYLMLQYPRAIV